VNLRKYSWVALGLALACSRTPSSQHESPPEPTFPVDVQRLVARPISYQVSSVGSLEAFENVQIAARVAGVVDRVHFKEGESVKRGALLVEIETARFALGVASSEATLTRAEATRAEAAREVERSRKLVAEGVGVGVDTSTWESKLSTALADVAQAKAALGLARLNLRDAMVRAAISTRDCRPFASPRAEALHRDRV
jgi:membrane fusion protein (multidrug efflux system)/multidrug efflux system membrane fusion protein